VDVAAGTVREALEDVFDEPPELRRYILDDQCRVRLDARVVVSRTPDGGNTFEVFGPGLPDHDAYDIVFRHAMDVDPLGKSLAMGSTTGGFWVSENSGEAWQCVSQSLPPVYAVRFGAESRRSAAPGANRALRNAAVTFFNVTKRKASLLAARKITTYVARSSLH
jgi:hypothetical protein